MKVKQTALMGFSLSAALFLVTYIPTIRWMIDRWMAEGSYYSHGFIVPIISLYFVWRKKDELKEVSTTGSTAGLAIAIVGLVFHLICAALRVYFLSGFSFVLVLYGLVLFFFGKQVVRKLMFPIFFLLAMVPLPLVLISHLTVKLKLFVGDSSVWVLNHIGFPCVRDGSMVKMPDSFILIAAPCSGLRSLIALLTLGILFAYTSKLPNIKRGLLFLSAIPIAMGSNLVRIVLLAIVNDLYGEPVAMGFFHDFSGFMVFALAFLGLVTVNRALEGAKQDE